MDGEWTYQLEVVLHGFTPEVIGGSIREVGDRGEATFTLPGAHAPWWEKIFLLVD